MTIPTITLGEMLSRFTTIAKGLRLQWKWIVLPSGNILFADAHDGPRLLALADLSIEINDFSEMGDDYAYEKAEMYTEFMSHHKEIDLPTNEDIKDIIACGDLGEAYIRQHLATYMPLFYGAHSFMATNNLHQPLTDSAGERRFWSTQ